MRLLLYHDQSLTLFRLVLESLNTLPSDRKCFRMINGVLVERTVGDVLPTLKTNSEGLAKVLEELVGQYRGKQDEMEKWKVSLVSGVDVSKSKVLIESENNRRRIRLQLCSSDEPVDRGQ
jgi:chaperonin cofactor prefoldin